MNRATNKELAKEARRLQRAGHSAEAAAEYVGMTVQRLAQIGGVMDVEVPAVAGCSRCSKPYHECECFKVWAGEVSVTPGRFEDR